MTREDFSKKFGLTPEQADRLRDAMDRTWQTISYDYFGANELEVRNAFDSEAEMISEATLDADRIRMYGGPDNDNFDWVYKTPDGKHRKNVLGMGEAVWTMR